MVIANLNVITKALKRHPRARKPLARWLQIAEAAEWQNIQEARNTFPTADLIKGTPYTAFNIGGNDYRLIAVVSYSLGQIQIVEVLTHAEYSRKY